MHYLEQFTICIQWRGILLWSMTDMKLAKLFIFSEINAHWPVEIVHNRLQFNYIMDHLKTTLASGLTRFQQTFTFLFPIAERECIARVLIRVNLQNSNGIPNRKGIYFLTYIVFIKCVMLELWLPSRMLRTYLLHLLCLK